jgi:hypothetical protein
MSTAKEIARQARIESLARMVIAGQTMKQAAATLGVHYNTARLDAKTPLFRETLERIREQSREKAEEMLTEAVVDVVAELRRGAERAARVMSSKLLHSENENIVFKAASDLLDRDERSSKRRKMTVHNLHEILTPELLANAAKLARELEENRQRAQIAEGAGIENSIDVEIEDDTN